MKIKLSKREIVGRKAKNLRQQNLVPANIYGPGRESMNVVLSPKEYRDAFAGAGYNHLIDAEIEGELKAVKILFKEVQLDPILETPIHVSFYQVDMNKPINTSIPVEVEGTSPAVKNNIGLLVIPFDSLKIMCLPEDIPNKFTINVDKLENIGDSIHIHDIQLPEKVRWDSNVDDRAAVAYVAAPQKTIEEEEAEEAELAAAAAEAAGETPEVAEGEVEGAAPADVPAATPEAPKKE